MLQFEGYLTIVNHGSRGITMVIAQATRASTAAGNTKGGSITVPLTSCLSDFDYSVLQIKTKIVGSHTGDSKPVKQEVNGTVILSPLVFPDSSNVFVTMANVCTESTYKTNIDNCGKFNKPFTRVAYSLLTNKTVCMEVLNGSITCS
jgi:hypothetical protein